MPLATIGRSPRKSRHSTRGATRIAASIHLDKPGTWTPKGRKQIAAWLRSKADDLEKYGKDFTDGRFRFSYHVPA